MIMLAEFLGNFKISIGQQDYFIDVLGSATLRELVNLPSSFVGSVSYAFVQPLRKRYSSKALWAFEDIYSRALWIFSFSTRCRARCAPRCTTSCMKGGAPRQGR